MKSDQQLKQDVASELQWDATVNATQIGVSVNEGIVTLSGILDTYAEKHAAERAARRVRGVRGIVTDLEVKLAPGHQLSDTEIAESALKTLRSLVTVPGNVRVGVENGFVTLSGDVDWPYQRANAERSVSQLKGVRGVVNQLKIKQHADPRLIREQIEAAFSRHARREARDLVIQVEGGVVTLIGEVDSLAEREAAVGTAWATRGVTRVVDKIAVAA